MLLKIILNNKLIKNKINAKTFINGIQNEKTIIYFFRPYHINRRNNSNKIECEKSLDRNTEYLGDVSMPEHLKVLEEIKVIILKIIN